ncbi:NAD(P)/FAD-dependent oxidoreductase [Microlunatus sp. Gsoil 973]|uniref:phytoene desaturase family protein n=1 Tax=Microlunatus sp. Gsoil 973 TaxID=2672569 RepID=UPI0012B451CD|nr:NAD(P)/FAD-dependent oxidoreductase [Microlunatus sp. Gsoil 973]QGN31566.1 FAD-dependent oxidoreductase [Microlunatus sp. Gsoil 973]
MSPESADVIIVGGGHNGLVAAAYLARAGRSVVVLEARDRLGGAVASAQVFPGVGARLSRFSYLVSLLPQMIIDDLGLDVELRSRSVGSYSPVGDRGLLVERPEGDATRASFAELTGGPQAYDAWQRFHDDLGRFAQAVAPTLVGPLPRASSLRNAVGDELMVDLNARPIGDLVTRTFADDTIRGTILTDALIGTEAGVHDQSLVQNRCFLYHVIGNGTGEWRVPVGGMGAVASSLVDAARKGGAELITDTPATGLVRHQGIWTVETPHRTWQAPNVLANCAGWTLARLLGEEMPRPEGNQLKINMVLRRLPRLRSGIDPNVAFAGTLHLRQGYAELQAAHTTAVAGRLPEPFPCEVYCHSLTDPSILDPELIRRGWHTLTLFGLHAPAGLFVPDPDGMRDRARDAALASLQSVLAEPLEDCLAVDSEGRPCVEVMTPLDVEAAVGMPGGHIFHGELSWPWLADDEPATTAAERWGVATKHDGLLLCGSSSRRGGAVSGLGGHSAAMALLDG